MDPSAKKQRLIEIKIYDDGHIEYEIDDKKQVFQVRDASENLFNIFDVILTNFFATLSKEPRQLDKQKFIRYIT
jgi:hypothetical protein